MKKTIIYALVVAAMAMAAVPISSPPAAAEIADYGQDVAGVYNSVTSGTLTDTIDNEVFAIEQIGNRIYVGGKFTVVKANSNSTPISQPYLAAFNAQTGDYDPSFVPTLDLPVYALQASPDGSKLFVGGEFGDVAGIPNTKALVALDPENGSVVTSWKAQLKLNARAVVYSLDLDSDWLYVGGTFDGVGGAEGVPLMDVSRAVKLDLDDAHPDTNWHPIVSGGAVWGIAVSPDLNSVYLGGYFSSVNTEAGTQGFVGVDNTTGATIRPGRLPHNNSGRKNYLDVVAVNDLVFVAGMEHITYVLNASDLSVRTMHSTGGTNGAGFQMGGDYQDLEVVGDRVYASCHCRNEHFADGDVFRYLIGQGGSWSRQDPIKFVAAYSANTGAYIPSFQLDVSGSSGVWAMHGSPDGCMWFGGDITRVTREDGTNQGRGGFTKHCDTTFAPDTERPSKPTSLSAIENAGAAELTWSAATDNIAVTEYEIYRSEQEGVLGVLIGTSESLTFTDLGLADGEYWYFLKAADAAGNTSWRTGIESVVIGGQALDTERPTKPTALAISADGDTVELEWDAAGDNVAVVGYQVYRATENGGAVSLIDTSPVVSYSDSGLADGEYWYYLKAIDAAGNTSWRTGYKSVGIGANAPDTERPGKASGFTVENPIGTSDASLIWTAATDNIGVVGYNVYRSDSADGSATLVATEPTTAFLDAGLEDSNYWYYLRAVDAAGNQGWRTAKRSVSIGGVAADNERPSTPKALSIVSISANEVSLTWLDSTDNVEVTQYVIIDNATGQVLGTFPTAGGIVSGLDSATTYSFYVKAEDAAGNRSWRSNIQTFTTS